MTEGPPRWARRRRSGARVYEAWERSGRVAMAEHADHWETPHGPILVAAWLRDDDVVAALHGFVRARCREGWGLWAIVDDLERLRSNLPWHARRARRWSVYLVETALAYSDDVVRSLVTATGRDALSGLPNLAFLSVFLEELVGAEAGSDPERAGRSSLIVITAEPASRGIVDRMAARILVADLLRESVLPELIVAHVADERFVVVLPPLIEPDTVLATLRSAMHSHGDIRHLELAKRSLPRDRVELSDLLGAWRDELLRSDGSPSRSTRP